MSYPKNDDVRKCNFVTGLFVESTMKLQRKYIVVEFNKLNIGGVEYCIGVGIGRCKVLASNW